MQNGRLNEIVRRLEEKLTPSKGIIVICDLVRRLYPGTNVVIYDSGWQLAERLELIELYKDNLSAMYDRQTGQIVVVLDHIVNTAQVGLRLFAANIRLNLEYYLGNNHISREQFFGGYDEATQLRMEEKIASVLLTLRSASLSDKLETGLLGLFRRAENKHTCGFSDAECRILMEKLNKIGKNRNPHGGYIKYIPLKGNEEIL